MTTVLRPINGMMPEASNCSVGANRVFSGNSFTRGLVSISEMLGDLRRLHTRTTRKRQYIYDNALHKPQRQKQASSLRPHEPTFPS